MTDGSGIIDEMRLFAAFSTDTRRYIVRALDFGLPRGEPMKRWAGSFFDIGPLLARADLYAAIPDVRRLLTGGLALERSAPAFIVIQRCADFDLSWNEMADFASFGFLYERLFGPGVRPWLTSVFTAAATSPNIVQEAGSAMLRTVTMFDGPEWNSGEPAPRFMPEWDGD